MNNIPVLFVEDNVLCIWEVAEGLSESGYAVEEAYCATSAMQALDHKKPLAALITDIDLGPGIDGFQVARYARCAYPDLAVVYVSGTAGARHAAEGVSGSEFVGKPYSVRQLTAALRRVMAMPLAA